MPDRDQVIKGLECCYVHDHNCEPCPYVENYSCQTAAALDALAMLKAQNTFIEYFSGLYGKGLEVANWHLNGATEPLDNFIDSAMEGFENA